MPSLNKVILIGNLTADPELKQTPSGLSVTAFKIGVSRKYKQGDEQKSDFINIVAWRNTAEFITKYFRKGNPICICGSLQTRDYEAKDGSKRYVTEVVADEANFVEKKTNDTPHTSTAPKFEEIPPDDDLPF